MEASDLLTAIQEIERRAEREFERRNIEGHRGCVVDRVDPDAVAFTNGELLGDDLLVAFSPYVAEVRPGAAGAFRVGSSKAWQAGKKMLGRPPRFRHGRPFHGGPSGAAWQRA